MIYRMATRAGAEDGWMVGVGQAVCATTDPLPPLKEQMRFGQGGAEGSVWLCSDGRWDGVNIYTVTSQNLPIPASIRRQVEGKGSGPLSKKAAVMTSEPWPPLPSAQFFNPESHPQPPILLHLLIHSCHDNSDLSPACLGSCICYQLNGQELFPYLSHMCAHKGGLWNVVCLGGNTWTQSGVTVAS